VADTETALLRVSVRGRLCLGSVRFEADSAASVSLAMLLHSSWCKGRFGGVNCLVPVSYGADSPVRPDMTLLYVLCTAGI
jgi:hypothetical protein